MTRGRLSRAQRKVWVRERVAARDLDGLAAAVEDDHRLLPPLMSLLVESDDLLRWHAIESLGAVAAALAASDLDQVRGIVRRLLWMMNEESGANVQHAPEAIGQILLCVPHLVGEYGSIVASFFDEPYFRASVAWVLAQLADNMPEVIEDRRHDLRKALGDPDPAVRAHVAVALGAVGEPRRPCHRLK